MNLRFTFGMNPRDVSKQLHELSRLGFVQWGKKLLVAGLSREQFKCGKLLSLCLCLCLRGFRLFTDILEATFLWELIHVVTLLQCFSYSFCYWGLSFMCYYWSWSTSLFHCELIIFQSWCLTTVCFVILFYLTDAY